MEKLIAYLNSLSVVEQEAFATRCRTTVGYLRKAASIGQKFGDGLCLRIAVESSGAVAPEDLRQDVDWQYLRKALATTAPNDDPAFPPVATNPVCQCSPTA